MAVRRLFLVSLGAAGFFAAAVWLGVTSGLAPDTHARPGLRAAHPSSPGPPAAAGREGSVEPVGEPQGSAQASGSPPSPSPSARRRREGQLVAGSEELPGGARTRDHALELLRTGPGVSPREVTLALGAAPRGDPDLSAEVRRVAEGDPVGAARRRGVVDDATDAAALALAKEPGGLAALAELLARPESDRTAAVALAVWHALLAVGAVGVDAPREDSLPPGLARRLADLAAAGTRPETRRCAALALARADRDALLRLPRGAPETAWPAANALATLARDGDAVAIGRAREEAATGCSPEVRCAAILALDSAPEPARGEALAALAAGDPEAAETRLARELLAARPSSLEPRGPAPPITKESR